MDMLNKEDDLAHEKSASEPPTLSWSVLDFGTVLKGSQKTVEQIISNTTKQPMIWLADTGGARWLWIEPDHGVLLPGEQRSLRITANTASLAIGEHSVTVTFSSEGDTTSMNNDTAGKINVKKSPGLSKASFFETHLDFGEVKPQSTRRLKLLINNPNDHPIEWEAAVGSGKQKMLEDKEKPAGPEEGIDLTGNEALSLSKQTDKLEPNTSQPIYVTVNTASLKINHSYKTTLNITLKGDDTQPVKIPVSFYVGSCFYDGGPKPPCGTKVVVNNLEAEGSTSLDIPNQDNKPVKWKLTSDAPWLKLTTYGPEQLAVGAHQAVAVTVQSAGLTSGPHTTDLHLTLDFVPSNGHTTELDIPVTVEVP